jgi:hypothetical protein
MTQAPTAISARATNRVAQVAQGAGPGWMFAYLLVQISCQIALIIPGLSPARVVARSAAFGASLGMLALVPGRTLFHHPVRVLAVLIVVILALSALNPDGAAPTAVLAHWAFHLSILAPVFWGARLRVSHRSFQALFVLIWLFSTASAVVGVLQAYYPGRFLPAAGMMASEHSARQFAALMIRLSSGEWIPRPTGLTDAPGGATAGGSYAVLLGIGIALTKPFPFARVAAAGGVVAGMTCLYLCQVRAAIVMLMVCVLSVLAIFTWAGRVSRSLTIFIVTGILVLGAFAFARSLGGDTVTQRIATLVADNPGTVYYGARGRYLEDLMDQIPMYPLGAGLGRWGMISYYFGGTSDLWAEIQWTAWLYDGGLPLLFVYPLAIVMMIRHSVQVALRSRSPTLEVWGAVVAGYNLGALALTFSYQAFMSTTGIEFWLINAALIQAAHSTDLENEPVRAQEEGARS